MVTPPREQYLGKTAARVRSPQERGEPEVRLHKNESTEGLYLDLGAKTTEDSREAKPNLQAKFASPICKPNPQAELQAELLGPRRF